MHYQFETVGVVFKNYCFKLIYLYRIPNFFTNCTPFLNRAWIKRQSKVVPERAFILFCHLDPICHSPSLQWFKCDWRYEGKRPFMVEKLLMRPSCTCQRFQNKFLIKKITRCTFYLLSNNKSCPILDHFYFSFEGVGFSMN